MRIFIDNKWQKLNNFIDYLIEHFNETGKKYKFKLKAEDIYDKRLIDKRMKSLNNKLLLQFDDGFEIADIDFNALKENFPELIQKLAITEKNFSEKLIHFELTFTDKKEFAQLSFNFLK